MQPLFVLAGPTACGKTAVAVALAKRVGGEVVSADSAQIYRGMDIGTAKPTAGEREGVPHHLIDIVSPQETFSAAAFQTPAREAIADICARGKTPILAGGTGFYINGVLYDWSFAGTTDEQRRPFYENLRFLVLHRDRAQMYAAINARVRAMFAAGLVREVEALLQAGAGKTALQAIGYKEVIPYLRGERPLEAVLADIQQNTRRYAKRQLTWFRHQAPPGAEWLCMDGLSPAEAADRILERENSHV